MRVRRALQVTLRTPLQDPGQDDRDGKAQQDDNRDGGPDRRRQLKPVSDQLRDLQDDETDRPIRGGDPEYLSPLEFGEETLVRGSLGHGREDRANQYGRASVATPGFPF